jgi:hypothetical protein
MFFYKGNDRKKAEFLTTKHQKSRTGEAAAAKATKVINVANDAVTESHDVASTSRPLKRKVSMEREKRASKLPRLSEPTSPVPNHQQSSFASSTVTPLNERETITLPDDSPTTQSTQENCSSISQSTEHALPSVTQLPKPSHVTIVPTHVCCAKKYIYMLA